MQVLSIAMQAKLEHIATDGINKLLPTCTVSV